MKYIPSSHITPNPLCHSHESALRIVNPRPRGNSTIFKKRKVKEGRASLELNVIDFKVQPSKKLENRILFYPLTEYDVDSPDSDVSSDLNTDS